MNINKLTELYGDNAALLEELYYSWKKDPSSVSREWTDLFVSIDSNGFAATEQGPERKSGVPEIINLLNSYRRQGHLAANLDPLGIHKPDRSYIEKKLSRYSSDDLKKTVNSRTKKLGDARLDEIIKWFEKTYCATIGSEHFYLVNETERTWLQRYMEEHANEEPLSQREKLRIYEKLFQADYFENFLAKKYVGKKRFSLEGGDTLIPMLDMMIEEAGRHMMDHIVFGMAHRGRLNVLVNTIQKPAGLIFAEFDEMINKDSDDYADVKYHLGFSNSVMTMSGKEINLTLGFNPSHLEAVNPVITGSVRARQTVAGDTDRSRFMPVLIHGDAAFAGQGIVAETLNLMNLEGFDTGGTLHIVINNQIGFTTLPDESRSTLYATDLAKGFQVPIFHVNGDDPEAAVRLIKMAMSYRQKFNKDVIIDLVCFRRHGHNEMDEPAFTQPEMYNLISQHPPVYKIYEEKLLSSGQTGNDDLNFIKEGIKTGLEDSFNRARENEIPMKVDTMKGVWSKFDKNNLLDSEPGTKLLQEQMQKIATALTTPPDDFQPNAKLKKLMSSREAMYKGEIPVDWGFAELLSFGSILMNGIRIRLSGQDTQRGTFSHRHAVMVDIDSGKKYTALNHIYQEQAQIEIINSSLSEYAVLGFEFGYSLADPEALVIWEAQFGDFANTAQVIIDQFISSSETKWHRHSGIVLLLPHGYEGQGPEHSSARIERFLQLCALDNMQVTNCTTPAQFFHLLRRQILRNFRKPLVNFSPKSLLRNPEAVSTLDEITSGRFHEVIDDASASPAETKRVLFCSGKVYYDLQKYKTDNKRNDAAIVRIEQLYPFPEKQIRNIIDKYKKAGEYRWVQAEPKNQGTWLFCEDLFNELIANEQRIKFVGRKSFPSPAAGHMKVHTAEQKKLVEEAFQ